MTTSTQILNWLSTCLEQPLGSLTENFYYDKSKNEFFSILFTDYFMLDEDMNLASDVTTSYTKAQEDSLVNRIKRIENNDIYIIHVPQIDLEERKLFMTQFIETLTDSELIEILEQRVKNQDYGSKFDFYFGDEANESTKQKWEEEKSFFLRQKAEQFLNINNINIETASIWDVEASGSISIDLTKDKENIFGQDTGIKRPWWKFWYTTYTEKYKQPLTQYLRFLGLHCLG